MGILSMGWVKLLKMYFWGEKLQIMPLIVFKDYYFTSSEYPFMSLENKKINNIIFIKGLLLCQVLSLYFTYKIECFKYP